MQTLDQHQSIKSWPKNERPRERLLESGAASLSDAELLAVLLRTGIPGRDAVSFARELLSEFGGLRGLLAQEPKVFLRRKGLGPAKAAMLSAALEIAKRQLREQIIGRSAVRDPESVLNYLYAALRDKKKEVFKVIFLNKANEIIADKDLFEGTLDEAAIYPREIVKAALDFHASAIIIVHNHPSGRVVPSPEDKAITRKIIEACAVVNLKVLDHIIVGANGHLSFQSAGLIGREA